MRVSACATVPAQGNGRFDPVRDLLKLAPPRGLPRNDFAASLLRGMTEEGGEDTGRRFDMVWDLVRSMRATPEGLPGTGTGSKYDPVWRLLEEARLEKVGGVACGV